MAMNIEQIIRHYGIKPLAREAGCHESAIRQWLRGDQVNPPKGLAGALNRVAEREIEVARAAKKISKQLSQSP